MIPKVLKQIALRTDVFKKRVVSTNVQYNKKNDEPWKGKISSMRNKDKLKKVK